MHSVIYGMKNPCERGGRESRVKHNKRRTQYRHGSSGRILTLHENMYHALHFKIPKMHGNRDAARYPYCHAVTKVEEITGPPHERITKYIHHQM